MFQYRLGRLLLLPLYILLSMFDRARDGWRLFVEDWQDLGDA